MSDESTAVATREGSSSITRPARHDFTDKQKELIRATVARDCNLAEFHMFLELCAKYDLDPFAKEIYAAKMGNKNGETGNVVMIVGRDGLLKIAGRTGEFLGIEGDVVREQDTFSKAAGTHLPDHSYSGGPKMRGAIVGAWAVAYRQGRQPTYFFAPLEEYKPPPGKKLDYSPWSSQISAMILKCAESMALRKAFSITGVAGEEEMARNRMLASMSNEDAPVQIEQAVEWGDNEVLAVWLQQLVEAANTVQPDMYRPAKLKAKLAGRSEEEREEFAVEVVEWLIGRDADVPARPSQDEVDAARAAAEEAARAEEEAEDAAAEVVHDAEVVGDDEPEGEYQPSDPEADIPFVVDPEIEGQGSLDADGEG